MRSNGYQAAAYMAALAKNGARGVRNFCLRTCRQAWALPVDQRSAILEWQSIPAKDKHLDPMKAPVGAPHFWKVGRSGHVAIQAEHEGFVWSTDLPYTDRVGLVHVSMPARKWGAKYLGWSSSFQNHPLPLSVEAPKV